MTIDERRLLNARIAEMLHWALVYIRNATFSPIPEEPDWREEINDLADLLHNLPRYLVGHDEYAIDSTKQLREAIVEHVGKFHPEIDPATNRMVSILDMDEKEFLEVYGQRQWSEPQPASAARN